MNYYDDNGKLVGFETEFSTALCEKLGVTPEFIEINWDTKEVELAAKNIDCIWNGLTVTEERKENIGFSDSYIKNMQVVVIKADKADTYKDTASLASANLVAEVGSAGESAIQADESLKSASYTAVPKQADALMEVKAGTADAAVIDYVMAKAMVGEGTDYSELMILPNLELAVEEYAIGFRVGSNIIPKANEIIAELIADGTLDSIAATYGLTDSLLSNQ
ncbi:L-cystine-binding protein FliY [bioreactor metagenome]|uniref:L-cystine-binding protein FliY n=1 Tax=bioreactor metagenome TaxID=1076179 RepID=A0A645H9E6_9ZZZZ